MNFATVHIVHILIRLLMESRKLICARFVIARAKESLSDETSEKRIFRPRFTPTSWGLGDGNRVFADRALLKSANYIAPWSIRSIIRIETAGVTLWNLKVLPRCTHLILHFDFCYRDFTIFIAKYYAKVYIILLKYCFNKNRSFSHNISRYCSQL